MIKNYKADIARYVASEYRNSLLTLSLKEGLWALAEYRFSHWVYYDVHIPILRQILGFISVFWHRIIITLTRIELPKYTHVAPGVYIPHGGSIVIHPDVMIGKYCTISHGVTIGIGGRGKNKGCPKIGDEVYIAPGAKIFGKISIGSYAAIGANAVVTKDIPEKGVAVGIPAQVISDKGSQDFIFTPERPVEPYWE
jgi:serine O-acetyltransferase